MGSGMEHDLTPKQMRALIDEANRRDREDEQPFFGFHRRGLIELAKALFPIDSLPDGALPIYDKAPDIADTVIDD